MRNLSEVFAVSFVRTLKRNIYLIRKLLEKRSIEKQRRKEQQEEPNEK